MEPKPLLPNDLMSQSWYSNVQAAPSSRVPQLGEGAEFLGGRFRVLECLGRGAFGYVYAVFDRERSREVALKTLRLRSALSAYALKREFRSLCHITHPNLVRLQELFIEGQDAFFTMDRIEGVPFDQCDRRELKAYVAQLMSALETLHAAGKLHRDIKPANVLVEPSGRVVVLDFGLIFDEEVSDLAESNGFGALVGTPRYMAPEVLKGYPAGAASDWYSLGVMLYETLLGELPDDAGLTRVTSSVPPPPPSTRSPAVAPDYDELCVRLLDPDPETRAAGPEVARILGITVQRPSIPPPAPARLVGRSHQLEQLAEAYVRCKTTSQPVVVLLTGESGMGKTALLREFTQGHLEPNAVLLWSQCREQEALSHKAFDGIADDLCRPLLRRQEQGDVFDVVAPEDASHLVRLFPSLARVPALQPFAEESAPTLSPGLPGTHREQSNTHAPADPREQRQRAYSALRSTLCRLNESAPLVLVMDDLQWGDLDSARLLYEVLSAAERPPCLLVLAYRSDEEQQSPCLQMLLTGSRCLADVVDVQQVDVSQLEENDALALAKSLLLPFTGALSADEFTRRISAVCDEAQGNPLLLHELAQYMLDATPSARVQAKVGLDAIVESRLERIGALGRSLFEVLCVAGSPLRESFLRDALGHSALDEAIIALESERLVRARTSRGADAIEVSHDRVRQAGLSRMSEQQQQLTHALLARAHALIDRHDAEALARHHAGAKHASEAVYWYQRAAENSKQALAFDRAAELYRHALELTEPTSEDARPLMEQLARALADAGKGKQAAPLFMELAPDASPTEALEFRRLAAEQWLVTGHLEQGMQVLRDVFADVGLTLPSGNATAVLRLVNNRARFRLRGADFNRDVQHAFDPEKLLRVDACRAAWLLSFVSTLLGASLQSQFLRLALDAGEPARIAMGFGIEAIHRSVEGKREQRQEWQERARSLAEEIATPHALGFQALVDCNCAYLFGEWELCARTGEQAERTLTQDCRGSTWELNTLRLFWGMSLYYQGRFRELQRRTRSWFLDAQDRGDLCASSLFRFNMARSGHLIADDPARAHREIERGLIEWEQSNLGVHGLSMGVHAFVAGLARIQVRLYEADFEAARGDARTLGSRFKTSSMRRVQLGRILMSSHLAYVALAQAATCEGDARKPHLRRAARHQRKLEREHTVWGDAFARYIQAQSMCLSERQEPAKGALQAAIDAFTACQMHAHAVACQYRLGMWTGGDEGTELMLRARSALSAQGAAAPERLLLALAPGV